MNAGRRKYSAAEMESMRCTPMTEVLRDLGFDTRHTGSGLYFSPFHEERTPSFHIDERQHKWYDHGNRSPGQKSGGDVFDLVMALMPCSFPEACDYLIKLNPDLSVSHDDDFIDIPGKSRSSSLSRRTIDRVIPRIKAASLRNYAQMDRHIPLPILNRYCSEVHYTNHYSDGTSSSPYAIGFPNIDGEWALRWPSADPKRGKISTGQNYTVISPDGNFVRSAALRDGSYRPSRAVVIFEGFMDFMSWLAWKGKEVPERADVVVLNSVTSNTDRALEFILGHDYVVNYIDADETGERYAEYIRDKVEAVNDDGVRRIDYHDNRDRFSDKGKDVNEAWVKVDRQRQLEAFEIKRIQDFRRQLSADAPGRRPVPKLK